MGMVAFLREEELPFIIVTTKTDKLKKDEVTRQLSILRKAYELDESHPMIPFSSITGEGQKDVWRALRDVLAGESTVLTSDEEFDGLSGDDEGNEGEDGEDSDNRGDIVDEFYGN